MKSETGKKVYREDLNSDFHSLVLVFHKETEFYNHGNDLGRRYKFAKY